MYKKYVITLMVICGLLLVAGCHKDSDDEVDSYHAIQWNYTQDIFEADITKVADGKVYFCFDDDFDYENFRSDGTAYVALKAPTKWFYTQEWSTGLQVGTKIKFRVEKEEFFISNEIRPAQDPDVFHFYVKSVEKE